VVVDAWDMADSVAASVAAARKTGRAITTVTADQRQRTSRAADESAAALDEVEMLKLIEDLPEDVVGIEAHGRVTTEDYERVLIPAVEAAKASSDDSRIRLLYVVAREFPDYTAGAAWEDAKLGLGHLRSWERIAIVSDADWLRHAVHGFGWLIPGEVKLFAVEERDSAREWVTSMPPDQAPIQ
jgi:hypothetical protein